MTVADMHREFKLLLDKGDSGDAPSFLDLEIDTFLNMAIARFITQRPNLIFMKRGERT